MGVSGESGATSLVPRRGWRGNGVEAANRITNSMRLLGKAPSERHQQLEGAVELNFPPQQCSHHVSFLPQKADPGLRVGGNVQIGLADMPLFHADLLLLNHDSRLPLLMAGEGEVKCGVQSRRLAGLEDVRHSVQEDLDA